ncbi:cation diffusion facilitator family transporter [Stygiolobus caldivivus]|uniref:cation diffusion facilitator family transporter n=1 Tax=Stygiolobus caldivivus TaxID=2824673 RepID=UPI001C84A115|nr:cation diffusion facilitator family transporter [Stygiolobus caldivivus]
MRRTELGFWSIFIVTLAMAIIGRSVTLGTESIHALIDGLTVSFSAYTIKIINKKNSVYTYGFHRLEVFSSLMNVLVVIVGSLSGAILALFFLFSDVKDSPLVLILASLSSLIISLLIVRYSEEEEKSNGVLLHAVQDGIVYLVGSVAGLLILLTKDYYIDPLTAIIEIPLILISSVKVLRNSFYILMERSPVDVNEVRQQLNGVFDSIDDIHVWNLCEHIVVATLHVKEKPDLTLSELDNKRALAEEILKRRFNVTHVTIQFESSKTHDHNF